MARNCGSYVAPLKVNDRSYVTRNTTLGQNANLNGLRVLGLGAVKIGNNFHSGRDCRLYTQFHNYEGTAIPYDESTIIKSILIRDNVWLGDQVIIMGGIEIGEGAIIQTGSVVVSDIPQCAIAGGHPARVFKYRDMKHYFKLKEAHQFH